MAKRVSKITSSSDNLFGQPKFTVSHIGNGSMNQDYTSNEDYIIDGLRSSQPSDVILQNPKLNNNNLYRDLNALNSGTIINTNVNDKTNKININQSNDTYNNRQPYNPYIGYMHAQGLIGPAPNLRYNISTINIDSRNRVKKPTIEISENSQLSNALTFVRGSKIINITHENNNLDNNDAITITGITPITIKIATSGTIKQDVETDLGGGVGQFTTIDVSGTIFEFVPGSKYMKIRYTHFLPILCSYDVIGGNVIFKNDPFYDTYDISDLIVEIKGFQGNGNNVANVPYYDNIPISRINTRHKLILKDPVTNRIKRNIFFIELPRAYQPIYSSIFEPPLVKYSFKIIFHYRGGIPINILNAEYPLDINHARGFHIINDRNNKGYTIESLKESCGIANNDGDLLINNHVGGDIISCSKIEKIVKGFPNANQYNMQLNKVFANVVSARLISTEFPNTEKVVRDWPLERQNNKIYWQNLDDGDHIYMAEIPAGNYKADQLEIAIERAFYETPRINYNIDNPIEIAENFKQVSSPYTNHNYIRVSIDESTDIVRFRAYIESFFHTPIISVEPEIPIDPSSDVNNEQIFKIVIEHPSHNLKIGDKILIAGAIAHLGIPANILNNEHTIKEIIDENHYKIELTKFNLEITRTITKGGVAVGIYIPMLFRLRFDYNDTLGNILGFRNVGDTTSITSYDIMISNNQKYEFELSIDEFGQKKTFKNNAIMLSGFNYVHMYIKQLQISSGLGEIKDFFAKILLPDSPGTILFNTFAQSNKIFYDPIGRLSELDIEFYGPDGELFDFNGVNHSFTIEITTADETPNQTSISAKTGKTN